MLLAGLRETDFAPLEQLPATISTVGTSLLNNQSWRRGYLRLETSFQLISGNIIEITWRCSFVITDKSIILNMYVSFLGRLYYMTLEYTCKTGSLLQF